jgi:5-methylcytosine-specific restriction endonuclease McrA
MRKVIVPQGLSEYENSVGARDYARLTNRIDHRRKSGQWVRLKARFRDYCKRSNALCHICIQRGDIEHAVIDYAAKSQSPNAFEVDHIMPWSTHPHLRYEWANLAASHSRCNRQRRDDMNPTVQQQVWVKPDW